MNVAQFLAVAWDKYRRNLLDDEQDMLVCLREIRIKTGIRESFELESAIYWDLVERAAG